MKFARPFNPRFAPPVRADRVAPVPEAPAYDHPRPDGGGTVIALVGLGLSAFAANGDTASAVARGPALGIGVSLALSVLADFRLGGFRNLVRADLMAVLAYYFLTFFEFLFPQPGFDGLLQAQQAKPAVLLAIVGFAGLLIGRHLVQPRRQPFESTLTHEIPGHLIAIVFWMSFLLGYAHMLIAVKFNVVEMVQAFLEPRFTQPWQRGRLGDWSSLLVELALLLNLIPPLGAIMIARYQKYHPATIALVACGVAFTFFYAFTGGTRNVMASYLVTFLIAYTLARPGARFRELAPLFAASGVVMVLSAYFMLEFRTVGLKAYLRGETHTIEDRTFFVDYNLWAIARLMEVFPEQKGYLGLEVPYQSVIRPIPRAIWSGKPEGLSFGIEDALGVTGLTIATTFVGEAYMAGGWFAVFGTALALGALFGWWNHLASSKNSELGILIYSSGFFAAVITMRSLFVLTTAMLPTIVAIILGTLAVRQLLWIEARLARRREMRDAQLAFRTNPPARRPPAPRR
jgi:hypothetical protein